MPIAKLNIDVPRGTWIADVSAAHPEATFRVLAVLSSDGNGVALVEVESPAVGAVVSDIEDHDEVVAFEPVGSDGGATVVHVETTNPRLLLPVLEAGVPLRTPFEVRDGRATWEITTSSGRLSSLGDRLDAAGLSYELRSVRNLATEPTERLLTDRQREVLLSAAARGYYDAPRRATLTEVSDALGISKATGSGVLHRAEGQIIRWVISEFLAADDDDSPG